MQPFGRNGYGEGELGPHLTQYGPGHIVLGGEPAPCPLKGHSPPPIFGPYLLRPNGGMDQDVTWYGARPRPSGLCVRWGHHSPSPKGGGRSPTNFLPMFIDNQTAGWMKLVLGKDVGLSPGDIVLDGLDGDPVPFPKKGRSPLPNFRPISIAVSYTHLTLPTILRV